MSVLDLNVENGEIEMVNGEPKPMLRVATPLFNESGDKLGIVIVNYLAENMFSTLDELEKNETSKSEIVNENGYYLYAIDEDIEFGFMYEDKQDEVFSLYHDHNISPNPDGSVLIAKHDQKYYTSLKLTGLELTNYVNDKTHGDYNIDFGDKEFIIFTEIDILVNNDYITARNIYISIAVATLLITIIITRLIDESIYLRNENIKRMKYDSMHDLLTTLPNRKNIYEQIEYQLHRNKQFALLFLDFDKFKEVNDNFGHNIGDEALIQGTERIKRKIRYDDVLGRVGGDEFIVILKDLSDPSVVSRICENIIASFEKTFDLNGNKAQMGISIGAFICKDCSIDIEEIIKNSDQAMYYVKNNGKNNYKIYNGVKEVE